MRQSAEVSDINDEADNLYPGVDFKLRLLTENRSRPEIALGLQSLIGHKRMSGEYLAASKRYKDFDFTAGLGWGRYGTAAHFKNPFKVFGDHFGEDRNMNSAIPTELEDIFTGEDIGIFGGIEYFTPWDGLSLKLDYGADRYTAESAITDFDAPAPWSIGVNYKPAPWVDIALGTQGADKIMGRLSLQSMVQNWRENDAQITHNKHSPFRPYRTGLAIPSEMKLAAEKDNIRLHHIETTPDEATAILALTPYGSTPYQIAQAAKHMANHAGNTIERLSITPTKYGLTGPTIQLQRSDLENAIALNTGSAEEIWHNTEIITNSPSLEDQTRKRPKNDSLLSEPFITWETQGSLSEEDSGTLYRTSLITGARGPDLMGFNTFFSFRLNAKDNLQQLDDIRLRPFFPVRSDVADFADRYFALNTAYTSFLHSFRSDLHLSLLGGYLEEMYGGGGGELLFRPHNARWALGAEAYLAFKRNPDKALNIQFNGDHLLTGHINAWYDIPHWDMTVNAKVGRYLAEDFGGTLSLQKHFDNGVKLEGYATLTNSADLNLFGGVSHLDHGLRLTLPLSGFKYAPQNTNAVFKAAPFGRDIGQKLENPMPLYDLTESFSTRHLAAHWSDVSK